MSQYGPDFMHFDCFYQNSSFHLQEKDSCLHTTTEPKEIGIT